MTTFKHLSYSIDQHIGHLVLKRPPVNALGYDMLAEIKTAAQLATADADNSKLRVLLISGEGKHFCAGADLKERLTMATEDVQAAVEHIGSATKSIGDIPVPVIALVQGSAMGGGFELALAADMRVFADTAKVALRETALAIIPGAGGTQRLPRLIGYAKALYWVSSAHIFNAEEAVAQGVAEFLVPENELLNKGMEIAKEIAANGPVAVRQAKQAIQASFDYPLAEGLAQELNCYLPLIPTADRIEGLKAFTEKRPPNYSGE